MEFFKRFFLLLPTGYKLALIVGTFVFITVFIVLLSHLGLTILSNVRAYTTGEGLWSKGQKDATYYLMRYGHSHDEADYQRFLQATAIPLGDHQARMELDKPNPDLAVVYEGFIQGGNHPDDVAGMAAFYRRYLVGLHQTALHPESSRETYQKRFAQTVRGERLKAEDMYIKRADGGLVPVAIGASITELHGRPVVQGIFHDLSERKQMEENMRRTQKLQSLGAMAGGLAHDFNNMLSTISIRSELALRQNMAGQPDVANITKALAATEQAIELTGKMLAYSGHGHFVLRSLDLNQIVNERLLSMKMAVPADVSISLQLAATLPPIEADLDQINQLLLNLVINSGEAIAETERPGTITIATNQVQLTELERIANATDRPLAPGDYVQLTIRDDGVGMAEETAVHIFDPFYSKKVVGCGLGLPVVLGIVRGHNGGIQVTSSPGAGTTIDVYFPVMTPTQ